MGFPALPKAAVDAPGEVRGPGVLAAALVCAHLAPERVDWRPTPAVGVAAARGTSGALFPQRAVPVERLEAEAVVGGALLAPLFRPRAHMRGETVQDVCREDDPDSQASPWWMSLSLTWRMSDYIAPWFSRLRRGRLISSTKITDLAGPRAFTNTTDRVTLDRSIPAATSLRSRETVAPQVQRR